MDEVLCPIVLNLFYFCGAIGEQRVTDLTPFPVDDTTPRFRRFSFSKITATRAKFAAAYILGLPEMPVEDVSISDYTAYLDPENTLAGQPAMASVCEEHCRAGIVARYTRRLSLRNVNVHNQLGPAVRVDDSANLRLDDAVSRDASCQIRREAAHFPLSLRERVG